MNHSKANKEKSSELRNSHEKNFATNKIDNKKVDTSSCDYQKRSGTSGLTGQLYETKLLTLILLRALNNDNIKEFILATNMDGIGAFDDIILRYKSSHSEKEKIIFLQAKHKDDPYKDKLTVKNIIKPDGDFSLQKYLESFIKIKQKFITDKTNKMFLELNNDIEYEFIIYTSANEQLDQRKIKKCSNVEEIIRTNKKGKYFQFVGDTQDIELLVTNFVKSRAIALAKALKQFIIKGNWKNIMLHGLIKTYHVFIAQKIIAVECTSTETKDSKDSVLRQQLHNVGRFRQTFWTSLDDNLILIRRVLCKEIGEIKRLTLHNQEADVVTFLNSLVFKLPTDFGNISFNFHGNEKKQKKRFAHVCSIFHKLLQNTRCAPDSEYIYVKLDDDSVGPNNIIQRQDLESYRLGGLVGNLLINDDKTDMLKFNLNIDNLSADNIKIMNYLQKDFDLNKYRFDINVLNFPKLTLPCREKDEILIKDFLNKLKFYTNQSKEDKVETITKEEIDKLFSLRQRQQDSLSRIKCDLLFLKIHDEIQKWWKERNISTYLTKTCNFYKEAEKEILHSPLLSIVNFNYRSVIKFNDEVVSSLNLMSFLNSNERMLIFLTDEVTFTSIKVIQYFGTINIVRDVMLMDLDYVFVENCLGIVQVELECSVIPLLIVISKDCHDTNIIRDRINYLTILFKGKVILITHKSFGSSLQTYPKSILQYDDNNNFKSFSEEVRNLMLDKNIFFQGVEVPVTAVFDDTALNLLSPNILFKIVNNNKVEIGKTLATEHYYKTMDYYIQHSVCRNITLHYERELEMEFIFKSDSRMSYSLNIRKPPLINRDTILTTSSYNTFAKEWERDINTNVHWFSDRNAKSQMTWIMSHGSLHNLKKFTKRGLHNDLMSLRPESLKDIKEKVVIISAEPGMGKSTFLTHIAYNTKRLYPHIWILKINLIEHVNQFSEWKKNKKKINLRQVMDFLYNVINSDKNNLCEDKKSKIIVTENANSQIDLTILEKEYVSEVNLFDYFYKNNNVAILLDGFDEICPDFVKEVLQLICILKSSMIAHLWITSRIYNVLDELELALSTFSFILNPFTKREQQTFLQSILSSKLGMNKMDSRIYEYVYQLRDKLSTMLHDTEDTFLSLPLHLHMIIEVYDEYFNGFNSFKEQTSTELFSDDNINIQLNTFYEQFINKKYFQIRFGEKKHTMSLMDPDVRKMIEKEYNLFIDNHKKIAAHFLLNVNVMLSENDIEEVREFFTSITSGEEKTGIIERIVDGKPKFIHLTFAEYFAAEFIVDKLKSEMWTSSVCKYFLNDVLVSFKYGYVKKFLNSRLSLEGDTVLTIYEKHNMKKLFNFMFKPGKTLSSALSIYRNIENIIVFPLRCIQLNIQKRNLPYFIKCLKLNRYSFNKCTLCSLIVMGERGLLALKLILDIVTHTDSTKLKDLLDCNDSTPALTLAFVVYSDIAPIILKSLQNNPEIIVQLFIIKENLTIKNFTISHLIAEAGSEVDFCWSFLKNLSKKQLIKIFSVKDSFGELPLHYAGKDKNYNFFHKMDALLGRKEFKRMCFTATYLGSTPVDTLYNQYFTKEVKDIIKMVYDGNNYDFDDEYESMLIYKLPKIYPEDNTCIIM